MASGLMKAAIKKLSGSKPKADKPNVNVALLASFSTFCECAGVRPPPILMDTADQLVEFEARFYSPDLDRTVTEKEFTLGHGQNVASLLQRLDTVAQLNTEVVANCKQLMYSMLLVTHTRTYTGTSEAFFMVLAESGILNQAAKDAKWASPRYREKQRHGKVALRAMLLLDNCTGHESMQALFEPFIINTVMLYVDPATNHPFIAHLAMGILAKLNPDVTAMKEVKFQDADLMRLVTDMRSVQYSSELRYHVIRVEENILEAPVDVHLSAIFRALLFMINADRDTNICTVYSILQQHRDSFQVLVAAMHGGKPVEMSLAKEIMDQLDEHTCPEHQCGVVTVVEQQHESPSVVVNGQTTPITDM